MHYSDLTRHHFDTAAGAGVLDGDGVRRGAAGSLARGTWVQFDVLIHGGEAAGGGVARVQAVKFLTFGCPHVIAVADWVALQAVGRPLAAALPESVQALQRRFDVPVEKLGRLLVIEDAWIAALAPPYEFPG